MSGPQVPPDDHVYADGMTFRAVRDAIVAAATAGMFHISKEMAQRYKIHNIVCMRCAKPNVDPKQYTWVNHNTLAIKICLACRAAMQRR